MKSEDAKRRQEVFASRLEEKDSYSKAEVADACRDAVADFARKILTAQNCHKNEEVYMMLEAAIRCSTVYDDEDDDDF